MNTQDLRRTSCSSNYLQEQRMLRELEEILTNPLFPADHPKMPHRTSARILFHHYKTALRSNSFYVRWELSRHKTLGLIVEDYRTAIRWLWVVDFETCQARRLVMVK